MRCSPDTATPTSPPTSTSPGTSASRAPDVADAVRRSDRLRSLPGRAPTAPADGRCIGDRFNPAFHRQNQRITFDLNDLLFSFARPSDTYDLVSHEAAHSLDGYRRTNTDGAPTYMSGADHAVLATERDRLSRLFAAGQTVPPDPTYPPGFDFTSGIGSYAYSGREEFWAETSSIFLSGPAGEQAIRNASPALYDMLIGYFARTDLTPTTVSPAAPGIT